jgi:hypothetical protein
MPGRPIRAIVVQVRDSSAGTAETNKYLAQTPSSIVTDQFEADGIARRMVRREPIGQTGSDDPTVYNLWVDIAPCSADPARPDEVGSRRQACSPRRRTKDRIQTPVVLSFHHDTSHDEDVLSSLVSEDGPG